MSKAKAVVIRGEQKLKDVDEKVQKLFNEKHVRIIKQQEAEAEEEEQTENELILSIGKLAIENAKDIIKITEQGGLSLPEEEEEKENKEENLETLTKSLESISGVPLKAVVKGRRRRVE